MKTYSTFILSLIASVFLLSCSTPNQSPERNKLAISAEINGFIDQIEQAYEIPAGLAIAVYTPEGVYVRGSGVTNIDTGEAVTTDTAFYIASSTKSFFAMALNKLHHRKELNLNSTLAEYAPEAYFPAVVNPNKVTLRALLTHTSGISNEAIQFRSAYSGEHSPELLWQLLDTSSVNTDAPLGTFQYTNTGYNILSILTDRKHSTNWQDLIAAEITEPAGMTRTTAYMSQAKQHGWSIARPHMPDVMNQKTLRRLELEKVDATMQSAGGMVMSANDALLWLELLINDGKVNGEQIVPTEAVTETRQRLASVDQQFGPYHREDYGLGWYINKYRDELMVHHFGGFSAFRAHISYLPERQIGVAIFSNTAVIGSIYVDAIANYIYDVLLGRTYSEQEQFDMVSSLGNRYQQIMGRQQQGQANRSSREWQLSLPLSAYAGIYSNPMLGNINIQFINNQLEAKLGVLHSRLEPFTAVNTARAELIPLRGSVLSFAIEGEQVQSVRVFDEVFLRRGQN